MQYILLINFVLIVLPHAKAVDSPRMVIKAFNMSSCVVINGTVNLRPCIWDSPEKKNKSSIAPQYVKQQVLFHRVKLQDLVEDATDEIGVDNYRNTYFIWFINGSDTCVVQKNSTVGTGSCRLPRARFDILEIDLPTSMKNGTIPAYTIRGRSNHCWGYDTTRKMPQPLVRTTCNISAKSNVSNLFTLCRDTDLCDIQLHPPAPPTTLATTTEANLQTTTILPPPIVLKVKKSGSANVVAATGMLATALVLLAIHLVFPG